MLSKLGSRGFRCTTRKALAMSSKSFSSGSAGSEQQYSGGGGSSRFSSFAFAACSFMVAATTTFNPIVTKCEPKEKPIKGIEGYGKMQKNGEKLYTHRELKEMVANGNIVVAFQGALYDVTSFTGHPGGIGRLRMAAGGDLEVYWKVYTQHNRGHITADVMSAYKIGVLSPADMKAVSADTYYDDSAYSNNPAPYPDLLVNTRYPYNAEGRLSQLTDNWQTPIGRHFVRNHSAVPNIDPDDYLLTIEGEGVEKTTFTLNDLKTKFKKVDVTTVIQCNGNRREDFHYLDGKTPSFGPPHWVAGAIGNATWSGVRLRDVIRASGMDVDAISLRQKDAPEKATQIGLLGYDQDEVGNQYCCSFPFDKAIDPFGDCILAFEMNGEPIPRSHGFPVRAIVPGHAGARNCKYLERVTITDTPCCDFCNWKQYAVHAPDVALRKIAEFDDYHTELGKDPAVQEMPVQSLITIPSAGDIVSTIKNGAKSVYVKGIAWGGAGAGINRVDVSLDNGLTFTRADLIENPITQRRKSQWGWVFFEKEIPIPEDMQKKLLNDNEAQDIVLTSKALNSSWNVQPDKMEPNWNSHGCCVNHWYRVPVTLCPKASCNVRAPEGDFGNKPSGGKFRKPFRNLDQPEDARLRSIQENLQKSGTGDDCTCGCNCMCGQGCRSNCVAKAMEGKGCGCK
jgi:sulfite oxidase